MVVGPLLDAAREAGAAEGTEYGGTAPRPATAEEEDEEERALALPRTWEQHDEFMATACTDAYIAEMDVAAAKRYCEDLGFGGFYVANGRAHFLIETAEDLSKRKRPAPASSLYLGFLFESLPCLRPLQSWAPLLDVKTGTPAVAERSRGRWLKPSHFVVVDENKEIHLNNPYLIGAHEPMVDVQFSKDDSSRLTKLIKLLEKRSNGSMTGSERLFLPTPKQWIDSLREQLGCTDADQIAEDMELIREAEEAVGSVQFGPMQSFDNAEKVCGLLAKKDIEVDIQTGWAIYRDDNKQLLAQRHAWNRLRDSQIDLDFTPRPVEFAQLPLHVIICFPDEFDIKEQRLTVDEFKLADFLFTWRFQHCAIVRSVQLGEKHALVNLAQEIAVSSDSFRGSLKAGLSGALLSFLCQGSSLQQKLAVDLLEDLVSKAEELGNEDGTVDAVVDFFVDSGGVEKLVADLRCRLDNDELEDAIPYGRLLGRYCFPLCGRVPRAKLRALRRAYNEGAMPLIKRLKDHDGLHPEEVKELKAVWEGPAQPPEAAALAAEAAEGVRDSQYWSSKLEGLEAKQQGHMGQGPMERRAYSWARTISYAQAQLGRRPGGMRCGCQSRPFEVWVLQANKCTEVDLAEKGYFEDANYLTRESTKVTLFGHGLEPHDCPAREASGGAAVRVAPYEEIRVLRRWGIQPDLVVVFMPKESNARIEDWVLDAVASAPAVVTLRHDLNESEMMILRYRASNSKTQILLPAGTGSKGASYLQPSAFSSSGYPRKYDDNGFFLVVMGAFLRLAIDEVVPTYEQEYKEWKNQQSKIPAIFWGILDIKYDTAKPVLERVKVLETGDGRTSKFSGDGAKILGKYTEHYQAHPDGGELTYPKVICEDKKLTHDLLYSKRYEHLVPKQFTFLREYRENLHSEISEKLHLDSSEDCVVLKLINRSRAAGVVVCRRSELDQTLQKLLTPLEGNKCEEWHASLSPTCSFRDERSASHAVELVQKGIKAGEDVELGIGPPSSFEEQCRHWWSNESPVFVAEQWCKSTPQRGSNDNANKEYDGTLRIGFALRRRSQKASQVRDRVDFEVDFLGGYWKLPKQDISAAAKNLRESVVSAARTAGTAPVDCWQLQEIYAALGSVVSQLFSETEPSIETIKSKWSDEEYRKHLAAYQIARLGCHRNQAAPRKFLDEAETLMDGIRGSPGSLATRSLKSFIHRARWVVDRRGSNKDHQLLETAVQTMPCNANALCLRGYAKLQDEEGEEADQRAKMDLELSLLLDPDFKSAYVQLGIACIRLKKYLAAICYSQACLSRHPDSRQCRYHIFVACAQLALQLSAESGCSVEDVRKLASKALEELEKADTSEEGKRAPCLEVDKEMKAACDTLVNSSDWKSAESKPLPPDWKGWSWISWRV